MKSYKIIIEYKDGIIDSVCIMANHKPTKTEAKMICRHSYHKIKKIIEIVKI